VLSLAGSGDSAPHVVGLVAREFVFVPKDMTVSPGEIAFDVKNQGAIDHNFVVEAAGGRTITRIDLIPPGQDRKFTAMLPAGVYAIYCSLPGHREAGMTGTLRVNRAAAAPSPTPPPSVDREGGAGGEGGSAGGE
jgi:uncharacterized cupredoxin-like copper-binding protein